MKELGSRDMRHGQGFGQNRMDEASQGLRNGEQDVGEDHK